MNCAADMRCPQMGMAKCIRSNYLILPKTLCCSKNLSHSMVVVLIFETSAGMALLRV